MGTSGAWEAAVREWARARAGTLGLDGARVQVVPVVNPSGWFANVSFRMTDGRVQLQGKLAPSDASTVEDMRRAFALGDALRAYRAPAFVAWIEIDGWCGYLTERIDGAEPDRTIVPQIVEVIERLHVDERLAAALPAEVATTREAFAELFLVRFTEDLADVTAAVEQPPFVAKETFAWMAAEIERLRASSAIGAFDAPALAVVHGDMHLGNVIVEPNGRWWIVDWDEIHRGDAAIELAMLVRPCMRHGDPIEGLLRDRHAAFRERFAVACRAVVLDEIIDTLADWVAATAMPAMTERVRAQKQRIHERALVEYRARYG